MTDLVRGEGEEDKKESTTTVKDKSINLSIKMAFMVDKLYYYKAQDAYFHDIIT